MKYGEKLEASVPGWSLHNVDYNSLKHQIKVHTTKDQATTAIAIPGQPDYALRRFEDEFYIELCTQHSRVGLFVTSKADEVSRRLRHLSGLVSQLLLKCADSRGLSGKRQRRFIKYYTRVEECGQDIKALIRFIEAQATAFQKILKKYRKWTGSTTLSSRFKDNILSAPKSFTNYNFMPLQLQYRELRTTLEAAAPSTINMSAIETPARPPTESRNYSGRRLSSCRDSLGSTSSISAPSTPVPNPLSTQTEVPTTTTIKIAPQTRTRYWNEYEHGSDAEDQDDTYVIYVDPDDDDDKFPGLSLIKTMVGAPVDRIRQWLQAQGQRIGGSSGRSGAQDGSTTATSGSPPSETQSLLAYRANAAAQERAKARAQRRHRRKYSHLAMPPENMRGHAPPQDYFTFRERPHPYTQEGWEYDHAFDIDDDDDDENVRDDNRVNGNEDEQTTEEEREEEEGYLSSEEGEHHHVRYHQQNGGEHGVGGMGIYTSAADYEMKQYQDKVLTRSVAAGFVAGFVLLGISILLVFTGRHRLRLEVDAGAAAGSAVSLVCACGGLTGMLLRHRPSGLMFRLSVWMAFLVLCVLNGMLLVLVAGSSGL